MTAGPSLSSLKPSSLTPAGQDVEIQLSGDGFTATCVAMVDGFVMRSRTVNPRTMRMMVTAGITSRPGRRTVVVHDLDTGAISNEAALEILNRSGVAVGDDDEVAVITSSVESSEPELDAAAAASVRFAFRAGFILFVREYLQNTLRSTYRADSAEVTLRLHYSTGELAPIIFRQTEVSLPLIAIPERFVNDSILPDQKLFKADVEHRIVHTWILHEALASPNPPAFQFPPLEPADPNCPSTSLDCARLGVTSEKPVIVRHHAEQTINLPPRSTTDVNVHIVKVPVDVSFEIDYQATGEFDFVVKRGSTTIRSVRPVLLGNYFREHPVQTSSVVSPATLRIRCSGVYTGAIVRRFDVVKVSTPLP